MNFKFAEHNLQMLILGEKNLPGDLIIKLQAAHNLNKFCENDKFSTPAHSARVDARNTQFMILYNGKNLLGYVSYFENFKLLKIRNIAENNFAVARRNSFEFMKTARPDIIINNIGVLNPQLELAGKKVFDLLIYFLVNHIYSTRRNKKIYIEFVSNKEYEYFYHLIPGGIYEGVGHVCVSGEYFESCAQVYCGIFSSFIAWKSMLRWGIRAAKL